MKERRDEEKHMEAIRGIGKIIFSTQDDATITKEEMITMCEDEIHGPQIQNLIGGVPLPPGYDITDCHTMFDRDASGSIDQTEFELGMRRLIFANTFQRSFVTRVAIADVMCEMKAIECRLTNEMRSGFARLEGKPEPKPQTSALLERARSMKHTQRITSIASGKIKAALSEVDAKDLLEVPRERRLWQNLWNRSSR